MIGAATFLITRGLKNRVVRWVMRLRQPRYLAGAVLAGFYLWTFLGRRHMRINPAAVPAGAMNDLFGTIIGFLAILIILGAWALPSEEPGFVFSEAEIQFLFPAPFKRGQLLGYKVLQSQVGVLFTAVVMTFFAFRGSHFLGMWLAFTTLNMYTLFVSFARARLKLAGIGWLTRLAVVFVLFSAFIGLVAWQLRGAENVILDTLSGQNFAGAVTLIDAALQKPPLGPIVVVPRLFGEMLYATAAGTLLRNGAILIAAAVALFFATVKLDVSFEDASIVASQRALTRRARMRGRRFGGQGAAVHRFPPPFRLGERGRPEIAVFWKNLIAAMRISSFPTIALILPLGFAAVAGIFRGHGQTAQSLGIAGLITTAVLVFTGPQAVLSDLRLDLLRLDLVKTFPLSAESLLAAELAAPLLIVSLFEIVMLAVSFLILNLGSARPSFVTSPEFMVCALVFVTPISAIQLLIQNGAMILFPAWSISVDTLRGLTALGQRMLLLIGNVFTLLIALFPAALILTGSMYAITKMFGRSPAMILIAAVPAAAILVGEIAIAHRALASQLEDIDIANDLDTV